MKKIKIIYITGFFLMLLTSCNMSTKVSNFLSDGKITEKKIANTPLFSDFGWSISKGAKRYYLENTSRTKIYTFTVKKTKYRNGEFKEYFKTYELSPGEKTEIGISRMHVTNQPSEIDEIVDIEIVGEVEKK